MCGLYILTFWIPYPGITALKISRLLMMMPLATNTVYLSGMCLGVILQSYSGFSLKKFGPLLGTLFTFTVSCIIPRTLEPLGRWILPVLLRQRK